MRFHGEIAIVCVLSVALSGCATAPTPLEQQAANGPQACMQITAKDIDSNYGGTVAEGAAIWAVVGGVAGALLGAATGGDSKSVAVGAAVGAAAGGAAGTVSGVQTAEAKKQYALQEAQLDCQITAAKADNEKLTKMVESTRAAVAQTEKRLADLETAYAAKRYSRDQAQKELASVDESTASIQHSVDAMNKRLGEYQQARENTQQAANNSLNTAELDKQIADLKMQIASAETDLDKLVTHRKVAQVG